MFNNFAIEQPRRPNLLVIFGIVAAIVIQQHLPFECAALAIVFYHGCICCALLGKIVYVDIHGYGVATNYVLLINRFTVIIIVN